jgi:hypothetical protein
MKPKSLVWNIHVRELEFGYTYYKHITCTPLGTVEIFVYNNPDECVVVCCDCSSSFETYILSQVRPLASRSDFSVNHIKQMVQCSFDNFILEKCCVV